MERNPAAKIEHKKSKKTELSNFLSYDEIRSLIKATLDSSQRNSVRNAAILATLAFTGCRRTELLELNWQDIDFTDETIIVRRYKNDSINKLPMRSELKECLMRYYEYNRFNTKGALFLSELGNRLSETALRYAIDKSMKVACISKEFSIGPHIFRHSFIIDLVKKQVTGESIIQWTGHQDTRGIRPYAHFDMVSKRETIALLG